MSDFYILLPELTYEAIKKRFNVTDEYMTKVKVIRAEKLTEEPNIRHLRLIKNNSKKDLPRL